MTLKSRLFCRPLPVGENYSCYIVVCILCSLVVDLLKLEQNVFSDFSFALAARNLTKKFY